MLRSFRFSNHRSFADEQELLLMPGGADPGFAVVPVAAMYGANASGKSNLLDALEFMRTAVVESFRLWETDTGIPRSAFRLNPGVVGRPSTFVVELFVEDVPYTYGFEVDDESVIQEWLYAYPKRRSRKIFERHGDQIILGSTVEAHAKLVALEELIRPNALFLSLAAQVNLGPVLPVAQWFRRAVRFATGRQEGRPPAAGRFANLLWQEPERQHQVVALLAAADLGISDVRVEVEDLAAIRGQMPSVNRRDYALNNDSSRRLALHFFHNGSDEPFDFMDESAGTRCWVGLLPDVLAVLGNGSMLVLDESDTNLHPLLMAALIGLFQERETNPQSAQLVFASHDTSLLGTLLGERVLDRDQIWFVEKDSRGARASSSR
ncbi:AAA family ATPase [Fodinicola feengrottensis]|uniref:AAA family ATPase n=1 Tax=Fodinicola feengrottensis TaxID=435914 RepID=UPI002442BDC7|nr:ATP-binding protein [Fodinicola feengrottensis]